MNRYRFFIAAFILALFFQHIGGPALAQTAAAPAVSPTPAGNLDFYLQTALQNSPLLKDYQGQLQAGQVDSQIIRAGYRPQVTGTSVNTYAPVIHGYGYDNAIS